MHAEQFNNTTIGADYLKTNKLYPIDTLLDYLSGLQKLKNEFEENEVWNSKYSNEIIAVKEILKRQTA